MNYHPYLAEIDGTFYAVPESFPLVMDVTPTLPTADEGEDFTGDPIIPDDWVDLDTDEEEAYRMLALRKHLDDWSSSMSVHRGTEITVGRRDWLVLTDGEADDAWDKEMIHYIDDCFDIPDNIRPYFNEEKWKADARRDGRGHALASYDGEEHEEDTAWATFYIFRRA